MNEKEFLPKKSHDFFADRSNKSFHGHKLEKIVSQIRDWKILIFLVYIIWSGSKNFVAQVGSGQPSMVLVWKISPENVKFFNNFPLGSKISLRAGSKSTRVKDGSAAYLLQVKSKLRSGQGPSLLYGTL